MKYALVCKNEPREQGYRVAEILDTLPFYDPAPDHMWVECADDLVADAKWFDSNDNTFKEFSKSITENQPITNGTQTI